MWSVAALGAHNAVFQLPITEGIAGAAARSATDIFIEDAYSSDMFNPAFDKVRDIQPKSTTFVVHGHGRLCLCEDASPSHSSRDRRDDFTQSPYNPLTSPPLVSSRSRASGPAR